MKLFFIGLTILIAVLSLDAKAQFKPSQQQYLEAENLALNPGFEQGVRSWTNANGVFTSDSSEKVLGNKSGKVALTAQTLDFSQTLSTGYNASLSGLQGHVAAYAKADFPFQVCSLIDGVETNCINGSGNGKFDHYDIPIVLGSTSLGIKFKSLTSYTGSIYVDGVEYGHKQYVSSVAQSEFAFDVNITTTGTTNINTASTVYREITKDSGVMTVNKGSNIEIPCSSTNPSTGLTCSAGDESFGVVFDAQVGTYEICATFSTFNNPAINDAYATFQMVETPNNAQTILQEGKAKQNVGGNAPASNDTKYLGVNICGTFDFISAGQKTIRLMYERPFNSNFYLLTDGNTSAGQRDLHISGKYWPPETQIVRQSQQLDSSNTNSLTATVDFSGTIDDENVDWLTSCTAIASGRQTCTVNAGVFSSGNYACVGSTLAASDVSLGRMVHFDTQSATGFSFEVTYDTGGKATANKVSINCTKQGADFNKSQIVYGQFEQIKSSDSTQINASGGASQSITANVTDIIFTNENEDKLSEWGNSQFTPKQDGYYLVEGIVRASPAAGYNLAAYIDAVYLKNISANPTSAQSVDFSAIIYLTAGQVFSIRSNTTITKQASVDNLHFITISKLPDMESIVKNLNDNKNVKCQTKTLSADVSSTGVMSDLTFDNITIGKKYLITLQHAIQWTATGQAVNAIALENASGTDLAVSQLGGQHNLNNVVRTVGFNSLQTADSTTFQFNLSPSVTSRVLGNGDELETYARLCELPDYYIETSEF